MTYEEYLVEVNKTWKKGEGLQELLHCNLAIIEEVGEIAGWYKKHIGYGKPKDETWKTGIKGEFGDIIFYITKLADITGLDKYVSYMYHDKPLMTNHSMNHLGYIQETMSYATDLSKFHPKSQEFVEALGQLADNIMLGIAHEEFTLSEIQESNIAKLRVRHGDKGFKEDAAHESGRDRVAEDVALKG